MWRTTRWTQQQLSIRLLRRAVLLLIWLFLLLSGGRRQVVESSATTKKKKTELSSTFLSMCKKYPPIKKTDSAKSKQLRWLIEASGEGSLLLSTSPQHLAACWILHQDERQSKGRSRWHLLQRYALATLHFASTRSNTTQWDWKMANDVPRAAATRGYWMSTNRHECSWYGIVCEYWSKSISQVNLGWLALDGLLPRELGLLTSLKALDLHACDLQGVIPHKMVASLSNLQTLELHMNGFFGAVHREIQGLKSLRELILFGNYMAGTLPTVLANLRDLEVIDMYANQLSGTIPTVLGQLKKLQRLDLHDNNLIGTVPREICNLKLKELVVDCLGPNPEVKCECCTKCCRGLPNAKCVDVATGKETL